MRRIAFVLLSLGIASSAHADFFSSFKAARTASLGSRGFIESFKTPRYASRTSSGPRWNTVASFRQSMGPSTHAQVANLVRANFRTR